MASEREFVLKWHSFSSTIHSVFRRLLDSSAFTDVTIAAENHSLSCHKLVLSACSTYFENLLSNHPHQHPIIILHDVPHTVVQALVKFMYSGEIQLPQNQLQCFLKVAETLKIKGLTESAGAGDASSDGSQPPPLVPATPVASSLAAVRPSKTIVPVSTTTTTSSLAGTKRRTPEPLVYEHHASPEEPGRDPAMSAKRRKSRPTVHSVHVVPVTSEPSSQPQPTLKQETAGSWADESHTSVQITPSEHQHTENGMDLIEEEDVADPCDDEVTEDERRLEKDMELVSGDTEDSSASLDHEITGPATVPSRDRDSPGGGTAVSAGQTAAATTTVQSAAAAAASTLISSCIGEDLPWKNPKWSNLLPEEKVMEAMGNMLDVPTLAAKLMKNLFTEEERINSNTTGDHGKQIFDKEKMDLIKSIVFHVSKVSETDQFARDDLWVRCKMKIDKWNRDLRYARKKKDRDVLTLPTMVKLETAVGGGGSGSGGGREEDWETTVKADLSGQYRWADTLHSPPVTVKAECSADV